MTARLPTILFVAMLLLAGVLVYQAVAPVAAVEEPAEPPVRVTDAGVAKLPAFTPPSREQFAVINTRAAFDPARQPVAEPFVQAAANADTTTPPKVTLVGVIQGGSTAIALLLRENGQTMSVRTGQSVDGWQVVSIAPGRAVFRAGAADYTLTVRAAAGLAQPPLNDSSPPPSTEKPGQ